MIPNTKIAFCTSYEPGYSGLISFNDNSPKYTTIELKVKDLRKVSFNFQDSKKKDIVLNHIKEYSFFGYGIDSLKSRLFAFSFNPKIDSNSSDWIYRAQDEYERLGFNHKAWKDYFVLSNVNENFEICPTYPQKLILPSESTIEDIKGSASFRSASRLPTIVWFDPETGTTLSRSSQPAVGFIRNRSVHDENLITSIFKINKNYKENNSMYIIDARSTNAALVNSLSGYGYENEQNYGLKTKIKFMSIPNIHSVRRSFQSFFDLCTSASLPNRSQIESTNWFERISLLLNGSITVAKLIKEQKASVLVHCSDGWDRTAQLTSLAQIMIDPYFRTLKGFCILIQKDWLSFGHKFGHRTGIGVPDDFSNEISPIFEQWMDSVFQIMSQFPNWFEFNEDFLTAILDSVHDGRFGTFLLNSEKERIEHNIKESTPSLWAYLENIHKNNPLLFTNPVYKEMKEPIYPVVSTSRFQIWDSYNLKYNKRFKLHRLYKIQSKAQLKQVSDVINELQEVKDLLEKEQYEKLLYYESFLAAIGKYEGKSNLDDMKDISQLKEMENCEIRFIVNDGKVKSCMISKDEDVITRRFVNNLSNCTVDEYSNISENSLKEEEVSFTKSKKEKIVTYKFMEYISSVYDIINSIKQRCMKVLS